MSDSPLFSLFHTGVAIQQFNRRTEKRLGLSLVQWCLLKQLINMPAVSAHLLAKAVGVHPSTLTQTLKRLEKKEYVFIVEDPKDSRKKLVSITRSGKSVLESTTIRMSALSKRLAACESELESLQAHLLRTRAVFE